MAFSTGYVPDTTDANDKPANTLLATATALPETASLAKYVKRVLNQGPLGSCVANAGFQAVRMSQVQQNQVNPPLGSRLFGYYNSRAYHSATTLDKGTQIRYFFKSLNKFGFCPESEWAYDTTRFAEQPDHRVYQCAFDQKFPTNYYRITSTGSERLKDIRRAISLGHPVVFGTAVSKDMARNIGVKTLIQPPTERATWAGLHAMVVEGYTATSFTILNSWGEGFGLRGRCLFSPAYLTWSITTDLWVVKSAPNYSDIKVDP